MMARLRLIGVRAEGEFFGVDSGEGAVNAAGNLAIGHGANHGELFWCPAAEGTEEVEAATEALGHSAAEFFALRTALNPAQTRTVACGFGGRFSFFGGGDFGAGFWRAGGVDD